MRLKLTNMKTERIVQVLYYLFVTFVFVGMMSYNSVPFIPYRLRNIILLVLICAITGLVIYYYASKKTRVVKD